MKRSLLVVFAVALLLRLFAAAWHAREGLTIPDEHSYQDIGATMADGYGYRAGHDGTPEIIRGPTYSAFLDGVYRVAGVNLWAPLLLQALIGALVVLLLAAETRRLDARAWLLAGVMMAVSPYAILYERLLLSEGISLALTAFAVVAWMRARDDQRKSGPAEGSGPGGKRLWALASGLSFGVLILAKPAVLLLPLALAGAEVVFDRAHWRGHLRRAAIVLTLELLVVAPWTARNWQVAHRFIPVGIGGGVYLYLGTMPEVLANNFDYSSFPELKHYLDTRAPVEERIAIDQACRKKAVDSIEHHPLAYASLSTRRALRLWAASHVSALEPRKFPSLFRAAWTLLSVLLVLLAAWGFWRSTPEQRRALLPFAVVPLYFTLVHTPISSGARYVVPSWPFVLILAAVAIADGIGRTTNSSGRAADKNQSSA